MLIGEGEYYRAVTELKRYLFLYPGEERPEADYLLGQAYLSGGEHDQAALVFARMAEDYRDQIWGMKALIGLARARLADGDPPGARMALEELLKGEGPPRITDEARIWTALTLMEEGRWGEASEVLGQISEDPLGVQMALAAQEGGQIPSRDPALSGLMSAVIPGSGQLYCGRPRDAVAAFAVTGLFLWGSIEAWDNDLKVTTGLLSVLGLGWYVGNIYNAVSGAHLYNRREKEKFIEGWKGKFGLHLSGLHGGRFEVGLRTLF
jgi:hypothetical protein